MSKLQENKTRSVLILVFLFELFSIGKRKQSSQIDIYLASTVPLLVRNQPIKLHNTQLVNVVLTERHWKHSEGLQVMFGEYSDIVQNDILTNNCKDF